MIKIIRVWVGKSFHFYIGEDLGFFVLFRCFLILYYLAHFCIVFSQLFRTFGIYKHHLVLAESSQFQKLISVYQFKPFDKFFIVFGFQTKSSKVLKLKIAIELIRMLERTQVVVYISLPFLVLSFFINEDRLTPCIRDL